MILNSPTISGSLTVTGNIIASGSITLSGSVASASYATSASNATNAISASYANNLTVAGTLTAQTLVVQTITSSIEYITGSSINGSLNSNTHLFTGSVSISGSSTTALNVNAGTLFVSSSGNVGIGLTNPTDLLHLYKSGTVYQTIQTVSGGAGTVYRRSNSPTPDWTIGHGAASANENFEVYTAGTGSFVWTMNGSERIRINSLGNVGIGTSSPLKILHIAQGGNNNGILWTDDAAGNYRNEINNTYSGATAASNLMTFKVSNATTTGQTTVMTLNGGGNVVINGTTAVLTSANRGNLTLSGTASSLLGFSNGSSYTGYIYNDYSANLFQWVSAGNTIQVVCSSNGVQLTSGATSWSSISDERLKNITGNIENAVNSLMTLRTIKHTWKSDDTNKENLGLIAQDVQKVFPQVIDINKLPSKLDDEQKDETEYLAVRYTELVPVLVKAIQELKTQNDALQSRIETLESK